MVFIVQLLIFAFFTWVRGRTLSGNQYPRHIKNAQHLWYYNSGRYELGKSHVIGLEHAKSLPFIIRPQRWYHRFMLWLGVATELDLKDEEFDRKYFFITDFPSHLENLLASTPLLGHIKQLFELPVEELRMSSTRIWCHIKYKDAGKPKDYFDRHYAILAAIAEDVAALPATTSLQKQRGGLAFGFLSLHGGVAFLGLLGFLPILLSHDTVDMLDTVRWGSLTLIFGGTVCIVWFMLIVRLFGKSSWVCWVLADFLLIGIFGFFLSTLYLVRDLNVYLPQPAPTIVAQPVLQKSCVLQCKKGGGKHSRRSSYALDSYSCDMLARPGILTQMQATDYICASKAWYEFSLTLAPWWKQGERKETAYMFNATERLFDSTTVGNSLNVPLYHGALGASWLNTAHIRPQLAVMASPPAK